jgi:MarR family transcriptional regulator, lower aerobic nicotinate degradation pathway regulator
VVTSSPTIPRAAAGRAALLLVNVGVALSEIADRQLAAAGVDGREYAILSILQSDGPGTQLELARLLGKAPAVVVAAIDALEDRGLVERARDPSDRRRSRVTVTPAGGRVLRKADVLADDAVAELLAGLDADGLSDLRELLTRGLEPLMARASA